MEQIHLLKFFLKQRLVGFNVPQSPHFESDEATGWFLERLKASKKYLEYGTGGSTYTAAKFGIEFIAVDSDPYFLKSVRKHIHKDGLDKPGGQTYHHANIGLTGFWGYPLRSADNSSPKRLAQFRNYSDPPKECFDGNVRPDLVLVDGRFRVACALKALRMLQNEREWTIVIDDYATRPQYSVISTVVDIDRVVAGRMAVFSSPKVIDTELLENTIREYECVAD